jgi:hypothetical protein
MRPACIYPACRNLVMARQECAVMSIVRSIVRSGVRIRGYGRGESLTRRLGGRKEGHGEDAAAKA